VGIQSTQDGPPDVQRDAREGFLLPDRGVLIVSLAILGWLLCPVLSIAAWSMATSDLEEMRLGRMDRRGYGLTQAGRIIALLNMLAIVVSVIMSVFATLVYIGAGSL
jgi:hypothetical protein